MTSQDVHLLQLSKGLSSHEPLGGILCALSRWFSFMESKGQTHSQEDTIVDGHITLQERSPEIVGLSQNDLCFPTVG